MCTRSARLVAALLVASLTSVACSTQPKLTGPGQACTSFMDTFRVAVVPHDASDGLVGSVSPMCLPFSASQVDAGLTCSVFATLNASGDESVCASFGLETPDAEDLQQVRSGQESLWHSAGGINWSLYPTCTVPQLAGANLSPEGGCYSSSVAGWCLATYAGEPCGAASVPLQFSPDALPGGALVTYGCDLCGDD